MEISDYLRIFRRRLWILILLPLLAAGAVGAYLLLKPATYTATATVAAPALVGGSQTNQYSGANGTKLFVSNYSAAITSPVIVDAVSAQTGVSKTGIVDGLVVAPINADSSLLHVTFTTDKKKNAIPVAKSAASKTLTFLFQTQVDLTQRQVSQSQAALAAASKTLTAFEQTNGVQLDQTYNAANQSLNALRQSAIAAQASGNTSSAAVIATQVRVAELKQARMAPLVAQYSTLTSARTQAQTRVDAAEQASQSANAQLAAADPARTVSITGGDKVSVLSSLVKGVVVAAAAALFLAVGLVLLLELLRRPDRAAKVTPPQRGAVGSGAVGSEAVGRGV